MQNKSLIRPFGEISFENEIRKLGTYWEEYFFEYTSFVDGALSQDTYLIVGRRGSGKSSLVQHFVYQDKYPKADNINLGQAENYNTDLFDIASKLEYSEELAIQKLVKLWEFIVWQLIFKKLEDHNIIIKKAIEKEGKDSSASKFIKLLLKGLIEKLPLSTSNDILDLIYRKLNQKSVEIAKELVLDIVKNEPLFVVIDSREQYDINNIHEMWITSALIQCASEFNVNYAQRGIHLKVCIADEIFPHIKEQYMTNTMKYIQDPLYMYWRPKDLMRLVCWRLFKYLKVNGLTTLKEESIKWNSYRDIYQKLWIPFFGETIINLRGVKERTFPYILRHTHLRPRQLIYVCNHIAKLAIEKEEFPYFSEDTIRKGVRNSEIELADELINSYSKIYPRSGDIIASLEGLPIEFKGNELSIAANRTAGFWSGNYSQMEFTKLVLELGIIGRKRGATDEHSKIIKADFEFAIKDRLFITEKDTCVIHPLFYSKLNINRNNPQPFCVYPFPDHPEFSMIEEL